LPAGPFLAYDHKGELVSTIYMIRLRDISAEKNFTDLAAGGSVSAGRFRPISTPLLQRHRAGFAVQRGVRSDASVLPRPCRQVSAEIVGPVAG